MLLYQVVSVLAYFGALAWVIKSRSVFNLGAFAGGSFLWLFDWIWCGRNFFNATFNQSLIMLPGLEVFEQRYPIAVICNWAVGFAVLPLLASRYHDAIDRKLGKLHFIVVLILCAILDMAIEIPLVSGLGVYTYHQAPAFEFMGVPWSSFWFGAGLIGLPYFGFHYARKWSNAAESSGFSFRTEAHWRAFTMAALTPWALFFLMTIPQTFWYANAQPWVESGRLF